MYIHFAFGDLGRRGLIKQQTEAVMSQILHEKRLKVSKCTELLPTYPLPGAKRIPHELFEPTEDGMVATFDSSDGTTWREKIQQLPDQVSIRYLPVDVSMICFIKITFAQLKHSSHPNEYGKFGIVLTNRFLISSGIKPVHYYTEESLWADPLIQKWNAISRNNKHKDYNKKIALETEITSFEETR